jgi:hypothetical protein
MSDAAAILLLLKMLPQLIGLSSDYASSRCYACPIAAREDARLQFIAHLNNVILSGVSW